LFNHPYFNLFVKRPDFFSGNTSHPDALVKAFLRVRLCERFQQKTEFSLDECGTIELPDEKKPLLRLWRITKTLCKFWTTKRHAQQIKKMEREPQTAVTWWSDIFFICSTKRGCLRADV
jgi:hypothetical protein